MADDRIKISELTTAVSYSGAYVPGVDSGGDTKKFSITSIADIGNKVDKEVGKGLSTNDYTTSEKNKLSGIASGAQANVLEGVKIDGTALTISSKAVNIETITTADIDALFS